MESLVAGLARRVTPYVWGVTQIEIDDEALKVGQFALKGVSGLTQDGQVFRVPQSEDHPPALVVPETIKDCVVYLSVPQRRQGAEEVDLSGAEHSVSRLRPGEIEVVDTMSQDRKPATLGVGKLRLQFALAVDDLADKLVIPIARIIEVRSDKEVILDRGFIASTPRCPRLAAALGLPARDRGASEPPHGGARRPAIESRRHPRRGRDSDFLLLMVVNKALPMIRHLTVIDCVHPAGPMFPYGPRVDVT